MYTEKLGMDRIGPTREEHNAKMQDLEKENIELKRKMDVFQSDMNNNVWVARREMKEELDNQKEIVILRLESKK